MKVKLIALLCLVSACFAQDARRLSIVADRIGAVCPIDGLSGQVENKATWSPQYKPEATAPQRAAAQAIIDNWTEAGWDGTPQQRKAKLLDAYLDLLTRRTALDAALSDHPGHAGLTARRTVVNNAAIAAWNAYDGAP